MQRNHPFSLASRDTHDRVNPKLLLGLLISLAVAIRLVSMDAKGLWSDEVFSVEFARLPIAELVVAAANDVHPPFYFALLHYWIQLFGESDLSLRAMSLLFSILSVPLIYTVGTLAFNKQVGILSALILTLSKFSITYAHEIRMYSLLLFLALLSTYFLLVWLRTDSNKSLALLIVATTLILYTHVYGIFFWFAINIYVFSRPILFHKRYAKHIKPWIVSQSIILALFLPWGLVVLSQVLDVTGEGAHHISWIKEPSLSTIAQTFSVYAGSNGGTKLLFFLFLLIFSLGTASCLKKDRLKTPTLGLGYCDTQISDKTYLLLLVLIIPIVIPYIVSKFSTPIYHTRYTIEAYFAFCLISALGLWHVKNRYFKGVLLAALVGLSSYSWYSSYYLTRPQSGPREAAAYINTHSHPNDSILLCGGLNLAKSFTYYANKGEATKDLPITPLKSRDTVLRGHLKNRTWLVVWKRSLGKCHSHLLSLGGTTYMPDLLRKEYDKVVLFIYTPRTN